MDAAELEAILTSHAFLQVERPPELWAPRTELEPFIRLLGEMISAALVRNGGVLEEIVLNVANVTSEDADSPIPPGDYVAISIRGDGDWEPETTWPGDGVARRPLVSADLGRAAEAAEAIWGYTRVLAPAKGSVTVLLARH